MQEIEVKILPSSTKIIIRKIIRVSAIFKNSFFFRIKEFPYI